MAFDYIYFYDYTTSPYSRFNTTVINRAKIGDLLLLNVGGAKDSLYYFDHVASAEPVTAEQLVATGTTAGSHYIRALGVFPFNDYEALIKAYVTDSGNPNWAGTLSGTWGFYLECKSDYTSAAGAEMYCKIYKRSNLNVNTLLGTSTIVSVPIAQAFQQVTWASTGTLLATDRIYIEVWGHLLANQGTPI